MHNFDLEKVLWNYKVHQRNSCSTTVKFGINSSVNFMIRVFDSEGIWFAFMNLTEDRIYYWVTRSSKGGGEWVPYERISDYDH